MFEGENGSQSEKKHDAEILFLIVAEFCRFNISSRELSFLTLLFYKV